MSIADIIRSLASTNSRIEKEKILKNNKDNELLKSVVFAALDPFTNYYIRKIPSYTPATNKAKDMVWALECLKKLSSREITGNNAIAHLTDILSNLSADDAFVVERIIDKNLECGVSEATVNKIWNDHIPTYPCMLASKFDTKLVNELKFPAVTQTKFDGMRFNAIIKNGNVSFFSRNGKPLDLNDSELEEDFISLYYLTGSADIVWDGELLIVDNDGNYLPRQTGNGILSKAVKGTISKKEKNMVHAKLWDNIPYDDFMKGHSDYSYVERFAIFMQMNNNKKITKISYADAKIVKNIEEAQSEYMAALSRGEEGIILKDMSGKWDNKRVKHQIKYKAELEADLLCTEWVAGTGKYEGMLGAIKLTTADGKVNVSVGTGFSDENRTNIKPKDIVGKIIAVKYNGLIEDKEGNKSLFLPVFVEIREDKDQADNL